ncbi:MAG TPA: hypothetical protein VFV01_48010 [Spirillospora sp.]|nr:hypothetical protein [Spirillospora sp.]
MSAPEPDRRHREAVFAAELLHTLNFRLTQYREVAAAHGLGARLALSDLATMDSLVGRYADFDDGDARAVEAMARLLAAGAQPTLGGPDGHFADAVYQGHEDEVSDALQRVGLEPYPEPHQPDPKPLQRRYDDTEPA